MRLLTITDTCNRTQLSRSYIHQLITDGRLLSVKVGKRRLIAEGALDEFIAEAGR